MSTYLRTFVIALSLTTPTAFTLAQTTSGKAAPQKTPKTEKGARPDPAAIERQATAIMLVTSLADEASGFRDEQLRARVQVRAADALWETDADKARELFRKAWETAASADQEALRRLEESRRTQSGGGRFVGDPPNLRGEVLRLASRRDRALGEELLAKLSSAQEAEQESQSQTINTGNPATQPTSDPDSPPPVVAQRLRLAREFLEEGDTERALAFADKALDIVTTSGIRFLSALREKDPAAADKRFMAMLQRANADPSSDAVTVSVLSSYPFTPFLTVIVRRDGRNNSSQEREHIVAPNISPELRSAFLQAAAQILLRPLPTPDQDHTLAGRGGLYFTIARLLPLFDQYAPDLSPELHAKLSALTPDAPERFRSGTDRMLSRGLVPEETQRDEGQEALENAGRAADPAERDFSYARAAMAAARKGDISARDLVDKIQDSELRKNARAFVDFDLLMRATEKKDAQETLKLARTGELSNVQRVWGLIEAARLMKKTDAKNAAEILEEAATEARRIGTSDANRARALFGVATRMHEIDRSRTWELVSEAIKAANSASEFTGEDAQIVSRFATAHGTTTTNFDAESFDLNGIFGLLAKDDLNRAIELAKNFTGEAPRATATLIIVRAVLEEKQK